MEMEEMDIDRAEERKQEKMETDGSDEEMQAIAAPQEPSMELPSTSASANPQQKSQQQKLKLETLLQRSENLAHYIETGGSIASAGSRSPLQGSPSKSFVGGDHRHRMTEKEEDEELLEMEKTGSKNIASFTKTPIYIKGGEMRDYQIRGLNWLIQLHSKGVNGILADEMGLGKTLQCISMIGWLKTFKKEAGPYIVIAPKSTLMNWMNEFTRWCPVIKVVCLIGSQEDRDRIIDESVKPRNFEVLITSYEMILKHISILKKFAWRYLVIDEAHRIKNEKSKLSEMVRLLKSHARLLVTGTPLQNNLHELWALLNFLMPDQFSDSDEFDSMFTDNEVIGSNELVTRLHTILRPFLLRRIKAEVEKSLLPKKELKIYVGMSAMQREWYTRILTKEIDVINSVGKVDKTRLQNILMHLRKCCNHPYLFEGAEPKPFVTDYKLVENCGKMVMLDKLLDRFKQNGSRVLIFSSMSRMLDILEDYCWWRGHQYCRLDGQTPHEERQRQIDEYNAPDSSKFIFMLTTRAGGLGINLATADIVIIFDSDWNPQVDLQAMDRAHRIGQKKQVYVYRLVTDDTVEVRIVARADMKLRLDNMVIQQGRLTEAQKALGKEEMLAMIRHGVENIFSGKGATVTDEDVDGILNKAEERTKTENEKLGEMGESSLRNFTSDPDLYTFEGENYRYKKLDKPKLIELPARERKAVVATREQRSAADTKTQKAPKPKGLPQIFDFQFYPRRLYELIDKEIYAHRKSVLYRAVAPSDLSGKEAEKAREAEQKKIDAAVALTPEEEEEKKALLEEGMADWTKKDFQAFRAACEKYGRNDISSIATELAKPLEAVTLYSELFWERGPNELSDFRKYEAQIEKGEEKIQRRTNIKAALETKMSQYKAPVYQLRLPYGGNRGKTFTEEEDRFLICKLYEFGSDNENVYEDIRTAIRSAPQFRFDWFMRSRTGGELQRRCNVLVGMVEKEVAELKGAGRKGKKGTSGTMATNATSNEEAMEGGKRKDTISAEIGFTRNSSAQKSKKSK